MNANPQRGVSSQSLAVTVVLCAIVALPASGQIPTGAIEGVVRDESGAILPGVTIEVSSPALLERTRVATADDAGHYQFLRLPVGPYAIKFALTGFRTVERANVVISSGFTATINGELAVGALEETLTVVGESPLVDVRSTTSQLVVSSEVVNTIPSSRNVHDMAKYVIGVTTSRPDVGGSGSETHGSGQRIHGSTDTLYYKDGVPTMGNISSGNTPHSYGSSGAQEEISYQTSALPASIAYGGVVISQVTKSGGNKFSGTVFASGSNKGMQGANLDDTLRERGVTATSGAARTYDVEFSVGGPIKKDKVWFFGDARLWSFVNLLANSFDTDGTQLANFMRRGDYFGKATWQLNASNKLSFSIARDTIYIPYRVSGAAFVTKEAREFNSIPPNAHLIGGWHGTRGNAWLFEALWSYFKRAQRQTYQPEVRPTDLARLDIVTETLSGATTQIRNSDQGGTFVSGSVTRVANWRGSHEFRSGIQTNTGYYQNTWAPNGDITLRFRSGVPDSVDLLNTPVLAVNRFRTLGLYAQNSWMIANRLTVNAGVRYDAIDVFYEDQDSPAGLWVPARQVSGRDVQTWRNVVPRFGIAYDLTGNARTVLKASASKYMNSEAVGLADQVNPLFLQSNRCAWTDTNGDLNAQASEISRCTGFSVRPGDIDPHLQRPSNREYSLGVQHQLTESLSASVMYHRRENRNLRSTRNLAVPYESYIPVVITNPLTNQPLTIYNQNPATTGLQDILVTNDSKLDSKYNGIELAMQRRFSSRAYMQAGYHYGKHLGNIAAGDLNDPNVDIFADGDASGTQPHQFKLSGSHLLPGSVSVSGFLNVQSGKPRVRQLQVGRALVPNLTRATQTVRLERNDENRYDRWVMLDLRFGRPFNVGGWRIEPFADIYNLLNRNSVLGEVTTIGPTLGRVSETMNPRLLRVGGKVTF